VFKQKGVFADLKFKQYLVDKLMMLLDQGLEVLSPLDGQVKFFKQIFEDIIQEVEHQSVVQVDHFIGKVKATADERMIKNLFFLP
jgi:hypothetical protein